jgi:pimeloyl-ACP methyl ester carboxylesterase
MRGRRVLRLGVLGFACLLAIPASAGAKTHWLCKPGKAHNPCAVSLSTTLLSPTGKKLGIRHLKAARHPKFDCFYVYPTVSDQKTAVANFHIDPELRSIALYQAARYTSDCRMFAPVYRQNTLASLLGVVTATPQERAYAYADVRAAWLDYLRHYNRGRGVVLMGHSQGSFVLRSLVAKQIDSKPRVRKRLISAVLLGGNVLVKKGSDVGGDFKHVRACRSRSQTGCVVAFSTYGETPPSDAIFGRTTTPGRQVLCTNPAALGGGAAKITPIQPRQPFAPGSTIAGAISATGVPQPKVSTEWGESRNAYRARCSTGSVNALLISPLRGAPVFRPSPNASWGLHLVDANIALGNLVGLVRHQAAVWRAAH